MIPKFRGLSISDNNKGQWVYGNLIVDGNYAYIVNGAIESNDQYITIAEWCPVALETIGAFIGLLDKNGVEIFEGDVVLENGRLRRIVSFGTQEVEENFGDKMIFQGFNLYLGGGYPTAVMSDFEVLGNIYQHPELLENSDGH